MLSYINPIILCVLINRLRHHILRQHGISIKSTIGKNLIVMTKGQPFLATLSSQEGLSVEVQEGATHQEGETLQESATFQESATVQEVATLQGGATLQEGATVQGKIIGQEDMTSENEEAVELISQGVKFIDNSETG